MKPKFQANDLVRTANLGDKRFLKSDTTNWSYKLYKIKKTVNDTIPIFQVIVLTIYQKDIIKSY